MAPRAKGMLTVVLGLVVVGVQLALILGEVVSFDDQGARVVAAAFVVGGGLIVKGGVEVVAGQPFTRVATEHKTLLQVLAFLALAGIAVGIVLATT